MKTISEGLMINVERNIETNAPPELSEPAMTNIRLLLIAIGVYFHSNRFVARTQKFTQKDG